MQKASTPLNIYYDENIVFAREFFEDLGHLIPFSGRDLKAEQINNADVLLVRSITKVNESLLKDNQNLAFVGTATIGEDHIDKIYLASRKVPFYSAPGCNAVSVAEYVLSALVVMSERYLLDLLSLKIGIVGAGNTGSRLSEKLTALGIEHILCDPFISAEQYQGRNFGSLEDVLACDVISLHVPITREGEHATYHLLDETRLSQLNDEQILINACRGEVIDNQALLKLKESGLKTKLVLDVWENEPNVLLPLIKHADIASAHIAGYSLEGKARGTEMLYQALCTQLKLKNVKKLADFLPLSSIDDVKISQNLDETTLKQLIKLVYDVRRDDSIFRQQIAQEGFDTIRRTYPDRREFSAINVTINKFSINEVTMNKEVNEDMPHQLGFSKTSL